MISFFCIGFDRRFFLSSISGHQPRGGTSLTFWSPVQARAFDYEPGRARACGIYLNFPRALAFHLIRSDIFRLEPPLSFVKFRLAEPRAFHLFGKIKTLGPGHWAQGQARSSSTSAHLKNWHRAKSWVGVCYGLLPLSYYDFKSLWWCE